MTGEALECLGGNGYVEESGLPRLYREAPLNSVWEGSGNVTALDVLRALRRSAEPADALLAEVSLARGGDRRLDQAITALQELLRDTSSAGAGAGAGAGPGPGAPDSAATQFQARRLAATIGVVLAAAQLVRHAPAAVADAYCASRFAGSAGPGSPFGLLPDGLSLRQVLDRARPDSCG